MREIDVLRGLLASQPFAVLSTCGDGQPYANIVAFVAVDAGRRLCFATPRGSRKHANLLSCPKAALLVDSRGDGVFHAAAATAVGVAKEPRGGELEEAQGVYLEKFPQLAEFARDPGTAFFKLEVEQYIVVGNFQEVVKIAPSSL